MKIKPFKKFNLTGKTALITGSAGLLGYEHSIALLESNANLIITDINKAKLNDLKEKLYKESESSKIDCFYLDVADIKSVESLRTELKTKKIDVNILINNAALNPQVKKNKIDGGSRFESFSNTQWDKEIAVGLTGAFNCSKIFGEEMSKKKGGVIINVASDLSVIAPNQNLYSQKNTPECSQPVKPITYSVIKHGLIGLTKYIATYWAHKGVRCNAISPGGVLNNQGEDFLEKINKLIPLGRMANKDEYRSAIQFLCSDASSYLNGHNLVMDGGRSIL